LRVDAWNKPDKATPQFFEMYKVSQSGSGLRVCLASTCIADNGFAVSQNYPIVT
jgi:hypothetical protein